MYSSSLGARRLLTHVIEKCTPLACHAFLRTRMLGLTPDVRFLIPLSRMTRTVRVVIFSQKCTYIGGQSQPVLSLARKGGVLGV